MTEESKYGTVAIGETVSTIQNTAEIVNELKSTVEQILDTIDDHNEALRINGEIMTIQKGIFDIHGEMLEGLTKTDMLHSIAEILLAVAFIAHLLIAH